MKQSALQPLPPGFAGEIVRWQSTHGRNSLPWQNTRDPYRVWLSEIMLQQTQVATVLDYYARFLERFPTVAELAAASEDEVLGLWSGLGYYSRARNLHRCAKDVVALHGGQFPGTSEQLQTLPGIGRSTAAAIASFVSPSVSRSWMATSSWVLTRVLGFSADLAQGANEKALWNHATELLPTRKLADAMPRYTQGLMDLGAPIAPGASRSACCARCRSCASRFCRRRPRQIPRQDTQAQAQRPGPEPVVGAAARQLWSGLKGVPAGVSGAVCTACRYSTATTS